MWFSLYDSKKDIISYRRGLSFDEVQNYGSKVQKMQEEISRRVTHGLCFARFIMHTSAQTHTYAELIIHPRRCVIRSNWVYRLSDRRTLCSFIKVKNFLRKHYIYIYVTGFTISSTSYYTPGRKKNIIAKSWHTLSLASSVKCIPI